MCLELFFSMTCVVCEVLRMGHQVQGGSLGRCSGDHALTRPLGYQHLLHVTKTVSQCTHLVKATTFAEPGTSKNARSGEPEAPVSRRTSLGV